MEKIKRKNRGSDLAMTTEQREAIEYLKESVLIYKNTIPKISQSIDTVLSLIKQLETEKEIHIGLEHQYKKEYLDMLDLAKKYKRQIDLMAEQLAGLTIWDTEEDEPLILGDKEEVINYFKNKVKGE